MRGLGMVLKMGAGITHTIACPVWVQRLGIVVGPFQHGRATGRGIADTTRKRENHTAGIGWQGRGKLGM